MITGPPSPERSAALPLKMPNWKAMHQILAATQKPEINKISKEELEETLKKLEEHWNDIRQDAQWDPERKVLHLRRNPEKWSKRTWTLPRSVEIHVTTGDPQIYVLLKGSSKNLSDVRVRTPKLGSGVFKEVAPSVNLGNLKEYVHATINLRRTASKFDMGENNIRDIIIKEIGLQSLFQNDQEFVHIAGWTEYKDKDGSKKIGITMELCNAGELHYPATEGNPPEVSAALKENINNLMQVLTDCIHMLTALEREEIINRDIKLKNLFLELDQDYRLRAKMGDFGLASTLDETPTAEQHSNYATNTGQMGAVFFALLTGLPFRSMSLTTQGAIDREIESSFQASSVPSCLQNKPEHLVFFKEMVKDMLKVTPSERPPAAELLARLEAFKASHPII